MKTFTQTKQTKRPSAVSSPRDSRGPGVQAAEAFFQLKGKKMETEEKHGKNEKCQCSYCRGETRPQVHDGNEDATNDVLRDMALQDAMDEFDE